MIFLFFVWFSEISVWRWDGSEGGNEAAETGFGGMAGGQWDWGCL
jgi:hypothetical protein